MQLKLFKSIAIYSILSLLGSCMNTSDEYITDRHTHANTSSLSIVEARYRTVNLLLSFYNVLTRDFGVGEWVPQSVQAQVQENFDIDCPTGYISETYRLAYAGPFIRQNWENALKKMYEMAQPYGFDSPKPDNSLPGGSAAVFSHPEGASISIGYQKNTLIEISTPCVKGKLYDEWPKGTENIPQRLRTTGRHDNNEPPETWSTNNK